MPLASTELLPPEDEQLASKNSQMRMTELISRTTFADARRHRMMKKEKTSPGTEKAFATIAAALAKKGAKPGKMFGMTSLHLGTKAFAGIFGDSLVFKLT